MTPQEVLTMCREHDIKAIDFRFMDFPGLWQHFTIPAGKLDEGVFEDGLGFDGSSIRGWQAINESDMLLVPEPATAFIDPFTQLPTLCMICNVQDPITREDYTRDPRNVCRKAANYLKSTGVADTCFIGPEAEFFIFDDIRFDQTPSQGFYSIDSIEAEWNRGADEGPNLGHKLRHKEGYFPCPPADQLMDIRNEMMQLMIECGLDVEAQHHEVATAGQAEIDIRFDSLVSQADKMCWFKYIIKNVARRAGRTVTFMPKPLFGDNGSGLHFSLSLWKDEKTLFAGSGYGGLSDLGVHALAGILKHAPALFAFCCPTTNSYKRLVPGFDAPINLTYSFRNRSAAIRIPVHNSNPASKRFEFRCPDSSSNPYLALSAVLMAALDGIEKRIAPGPPLDRDIYDLTPEELASFPSTPRSLEDSLAALRADQEFLLRGDVFTEDVIDTWIWYKTESEVEAIRQRPHPWEFAMYYDI
ncbi:MAG: type I glutamate--ammonia ligase [Planctomycetales bacterium]|nr:type I glutamate--ammonia ligase [Planctomycetales bacterium]